MEHAGVNQDSVDPIAVLRPAPTTVVMLGGATMEPVFATLNTLEQTARSIKKTSIFQSSAH